MSFDSALAPALSLVLDVVYGSVSCSSLLVAAAVAVLVALSDENTIVAVDDEIVRAAHASQRDHSLPRSQKKSQDLN